MSYLVLEDARGGVDRRRPIYALKPGTLWTCINAHITNGGDIEKRKAFVDQGDFSANTFGLAAQGDTLYTFGSAGAGSVTVPSGVMYQQLAHPDGVPMTEVLDYDLFDGLLYVIARYADGFVLHFYNGVIVSDWIDGIVLPSMGSLSVMAATLAQIIQVSQNYSVTVAGDVITVSAQTAGVPFTVETFAANGGTVNDQALVDANTTPNVVGVTAASASFSCSCIGGAGGSLNSFLIDGVERLTAPVNWATTDSAFAADIAAAIGAGWNGTSSGSTLTVTAAATGAANNDLSVVVATAGGAQLGFQTTSGTDQIGATSGGLDTVVAVSQVDTLTLSGTFDPGDRFGVKMVSGAATATQVTEYFGNFSKPFGNATCVKTHKRKMYAGAGKILDFSGVNDATGWNEDEDPGAGFLIAANHVGGSENIASLETYQGRLSIFARRAIQLWTMQNDDTLNDLNQTVENTGTRSPRSPLEFGGNDCFYLDDSGINSLRARDASNNAFASGVGAPINKYVRDWMRSGASDAEVVAAVSIVDPDDARFWMAIGSKIFVFSFYPAVGVAAWSWYEPGFTVTDFARTTNRVWCRAADTLYLYGGSSNAEYDASRVEVQFPFTTAQKPGTFKNWTQMAIGAAGTWTAVWKINPNNLDEPGVQMGAGTGVTYPGPDWAGVGHATHIAPLLTHERAEYASLSQVTLYFQTAEES